MRTLLVLTSVLFFGASCTRSIPVGPNPTTPPSNAYTAAPSGRAPLVLYDNFANMEASQLRWKKWVSGGAYIQFEPGLAVLDSPAVGDEFDGRPKLALLQIKDPATFAQPGDTLRVTFDMQLLEDRPQAFGFGLTIGDPEGLRLGLGQFGQKSGNGTPRDLFISGPHWQHGNTIDYGSGMLHYDATFTRTSPKDHPANKPVKMRVLLRVYKHAPELDANPNGYSQKPQVAALEDTGEIPAGGTCLIYFNTERSDAPGDPYTNHARGKIAITNIFLARP